MIQETSKGVWLLLAIALLFNALLVSLTTRETARTGFLRTLVLDVLTPAEELVDLAVEGVGSVWSGYFWLVDIRVENERLRAEVAQLQMEIDRNREGLMEAERLRGFLGLESVDHGRQLIARVIGNDTTISRRHVRINKGSRDGLEIDTPVMTADGIVGRVIYTGHFAAVVQLVTDVQSAVGVIARTNRIQGIARGTGSRDLQLEYPDDETELVAGDELITSGTDQIYPKGLPVGVVASMGEVRDLMKIGRIEPSADLGRLEEVVCLLDQPDRTRIEDSLDPNFQGPVL